MTFNGFQPQASQLVSGYLTNRKQFVQLGDEASELRNVTMGVPQGSILGPLLFLIYINDLLKAAPALNYILYADDTNILTTNPSLLCSEIPKIKKWCLANRLILNYSKTFQVIFKSHNKEISYPNYEIQLNCKTLEMKQITKFLGIILDSNIAFKEHISELCRKLKLVMIMMRAIRHYFDQKTMVDLYYAFFNPHLLYGIEFRGHAADTEIKRMYTIQEAVVLRAILI